MRLLAALATLSALAVPAAAHDYRLGDLTVVHPVIYAAPPTARALGGYLTIVNDGDTPDRLVAVSLEAEGARADLHRSEMEDGVMRMLETEAIEVPAEGEAALAPGGAHVMITGLEVPAVGDTVEATLTFERAGPLAVTFHVEARADADADADVGHGSH